ncbi:MAG TPA: glutamate decarboxylase [Acidimicrobiales bacterium]|nr:glutamate decarboxylase [Acidimicrobiales bacterium]
MLSRKIPLDALPSHVMPTYASRGLTHPVPRLALPEQSMDPDTAYRLIHDELALDANPALNLATFVTTYMDEEADQLMLETLNKNAIDWDEYPQTVALQDRCVNMLARLFGAAEHHRGVGTATVGSSEAIHLAGLAMKFRWRAAREAAGLPHDLNGGPGHRPNLVMGANVQVCWEKFARYFDVEPRYVPLTPTRFVIGVDEAMALVDEHTIGVVGILGSTYTGEYEPIAELDAALGRLCEEKGWDVPLHVDAASGGFVAPFLQPELVWDFRLPRVRSINVSGHKYGLVYPGVGWVIWREEADLPQELVFEVDYLGGSHANFGLNFSRGASQIVGQYYNFLRLGRKGYTEIMQALAATARSIAGALARLEGVEVVASGTDLPVVCLRLADDIGFSVFDLSDRLRVRGWVVPAYRMAADAESVAVLRVVVREGLSRDMADCLVDDITAAVAHLRAVPVVEPPIATSPASAVRPSKTKAVC